MLLFVALTVLQLVQCEGINSPHYVFYKILNMKFHIFLQVAKISGFYFNLTFNYLDCSISILDRMININNNPM